MVRRPQRGNGGRPLLCLFAALGMLGCGGDDEGGEKRKPDTGYGAGEPVPSPRSCTDLCLRLGDCAARLCNEDTDSTRYDALEATLVADCELSCSDALVNSEFSEEQWTCLFQSSCREVFDYDECAAGGSYFCE